MTEYHKQLGFLQAVIDVVNPNAVYKEPGEPRIAAVSVQTGLDDAALKQVFR